MALPLLQRPLWAQLLRALRPTGRVCIPPLLVPEVAGRRYASVKAQGAYKLKPRKTKPKHLGAKRSAEQKVVRGNIIYTQRGTRWWPGENCYMGRNHTIHAGVTGFVKYYLDPEKHPDRKFIGVVFDRNDTLPYPPGMPRKRQLNMDYVPAPVNAPKPQVNDIGPSGIPLKVIQKLGSRTHRERILTLQKNYSYREEHEDLADSLGDLKNMRMNSPKSRRHHFRLRRIKRIRRQMRLRTEKRAAKLERMNKVKKELDAEIWKPVRGRQRTQRIAYRSALRAGKTKEEAAQAAAKFGPRVTPDEVLEMQAKRMVIWADPWLGKNPGAIAKAVGTGRLTRERIEEETPKYRRLIEESRRLKAEGRFDPLVDKRTRLLQTWLNDLAKNRAFPGTGVDAGDKKAQAST